MPFFNTIYNGLIELILPRYCCTCSRVLHLTEKYLCLYCLYDLPLTRYESYPANPLMRLFWGRVYLQQATALLYFKSGGKTRKLIHQLKYKGQSGLAFDMGMMLGNMIRCAPQFHIPDMIVPVPLGRRKTYTRGYNQCTYIARGLAMATGRKIHHNLLRSGKPRTTQTRKNRYERYLNMQEAFQLNPHTVDLKTSILLVDDVVTTGATLESCVRTLQQAGFNQISIAALAWTS